MKGQSIKQNYGKQIGGGTRFPKTSYNVVSSSSALVEKQAGNLKVPGSIPYSGMKGK